MAIRRKPKKSGFSIPMEKTSRGFPYGQFADRYGAKCSIQASSLAEEACIWLGVDDPEPKVLVPGQGWQTVSLPEGALNSGRMHLTQEMARELAFMLQHFADTGELPERPALEHLARQAD